MQECRQPDCLKYKIPAMTVKEVLSELKSLGTEAGKNVFTNHGATGICYGVRVADMKVIGKKIKNDQQLAMDLYDTGVIDAMYLAGLTGDGSKMNKKQLQAWAEKATSPIISEYTVAWVASESPYGRELALEWIESKKEHIAASGWGTLSALVAIKEDAALDMKELKSLLERVQKTIHQSPNRVKYTMNGFVIALGSYISAFTTIAMEAGKKIGKVEVNMGDTACKVPSSPEYIKKIKDAGRIGAKRKTVKC
jgi:3-methyladenine DNA glycosylase AlkD